MPETATLEAPAAPSRFSDYDSVLSAPSAPTPAPDFASDYEDILGPSEEPTPTPAAPAAAVAIPPTPRQPDLSAYESVINNTFATDTALKATTAAVSEAPKADMLDLFDYQLAENTNQSLQGLFRGMADLAGDYRQKAPLHHVADALEEYRTNKLLPSFGVSPADLASTKGKIAGAAATVFDIAPGAAVMVTKMAAQTYNEGFQAGQAEAKKKGVKDPKLLQHAGEVQARKHLVTMGPVLAAYAAGGTIAGKAVEKLAPAAGPIVRGALGTVASGAANLAVSAGARLAEGGQLIGDLKQNLVDIFFGVHAGAQTALKTKGGVADAAKVESTGEKVGGLEGAPVDAGTPLYERPEQTTGARQRQEEVRPVEEAQKAPDVSDVSLTPNDLGTAIIEEGSDIQTGKILARSAIGEATPHKELKAEVIGEPGKIPVEEFMRIQRATHIFMDRAGNRLDRKQAAKALGLEGELQSEALDKLQTGGAKHVLVPSQTDKVYSGETIEEARAKAEADLNAKPGDLKGEPEYQELTDAQLAQHEAKAKVQAKRTAEQEAALEESKRIDEERAAKEKKAEKKAATEAEREQNREEARLAWDANPFVRLIIDDSGGILSKEEYKNRPDVDKATFEENKSEWDGAPEFSRKGGNPMHNQIYSRSGRMPNKVVQDLIDDNKLAHDATASDMWQVLRDLSEKAAEALKRNKKGDVVAPEDYIPPEHLGRPDAHVFEHGAMGAEKFGVLQSGRKPMRLANADVDAAQIGRGAEPLMSQARVGHPIQWDRAMARIDADHTAPGRLVDEVNAGEKESTTAVEQLMMLHEWIRLNNERQMEAARSQDRNESADLRKQAREKFRAQQDRLYEVEAAMRIAGTEAGRTLQIRQAMVFDDYTLAVAMERAVKTKGDELSPQEQQDVREGVDKVDATKRDWQKAKDEQSKQDAVETLAKHLKEYLAEAKTEVKGKTLRDKLHEQRDAARVRAAKRLKEGRLFSGVPDPEALLDATIIGASHIADGLAKAGKITREWSSAMVRDLGEKVKPFLEQIFGLSRDYHEAARSARDKEQAGKAREARPKKAKPSPTEAVRTAAEEGEGLTKQHVFGLVDEYIKAGMTELEPIMREVTKDLQESFPGITEREVRDLYTEYGKIRFPSQEEDARTHRELRRQGQLVSGIEDTAEFKRAKEAGEETKGLGPKPSGSKRDLPSQKVRGLTRQLKEDMRAAGFDSGPSPAKLKGSLDAIKTGLRNRIEDLTKAITDRKRIVAEEKTKVPRDAEAQALTAIRDKLQKEYEKIFKKRGLTDEEVVARAIKFRERRLQQINDLIDERLAKLAAGDIKAKKPKVQRTDNLEILKAKQELEKVNKMISDARDALKPPKKTALDKYKAYLDKKTADIRKRLADKNYTKPTRQKTELDNEALRKKADYTLAQRELDANIELMRLRAQGIVRKTGRVIGEAARLSRSVLTSFDLSAVLAQGGMYTMAHPLRAAKIIPHMLRAMGHPTLEDIRTFIPHPIRTVKRIGTRGEQFLQMIEEEVKARPNYPKYLESKLYMSESSQLSKMEEVYMSRLQKHVPVVAASGRAFNAFLTRMRADAWDALAESLPFGREPTKEEALTISNAINVMSGRGSLGEGGKAAQVAAGLNGWLFAPRLAYSRFETILGQPIFGKRARAGGPAVQRLIAKEYGRALMGASVILALGLLAGATIEPDPRSSDFGKLKFGNTRVDVFWGLLPATVFLARAITGKIRKIPAPTKLGPKVDLRRGEVKQYALGDLGRDFLRNKLAPVPGAGWDAAEILHHRKPPPGHGQTLTEVGAKLTLPINVGDIYQAMQDQGIARGTALGVLSTFGARLGTYQERPNQAGAFPKMRKSRGGGGIVP